MYVDLWGGLCDEHTSSTEVAAPVSVSFSFCPFFHYPHPCPPFNFVCVWIDSFFFFPFFLFFFLANSSVIVLSVDWSWRNCSTQRWIGFFSIFFFPSYLFSFFRFSFFSFPSCLVRRAEREGIIISLGRRTRTRFYASVRPVTRPRRSHDPYAPQHARARLLRIATCTF